MFPDQASKNKVLVDSIPLQCQRDLPRSLDPAAKTGRASPLASFVLQALRQKSAGTKDCEETPVITM